jgi:hypothetical protein
MLRWEVYQSETTPYNNDQACENNAISKQTSKQRYHNTAANKPREFSTF